jgi:hypothetical protein
MAVRHVFGTLPSFARILGLTGGSACPTRRRIYFEMSEVQGLPSGRRKASCPTLVKLLKQFQPQILLGILAKLLGAHLEFLRHTLEIVIHR